MLNGLMDNIDQLIQEKYEIQYILQVCVKTTGKML